jgi:RNA polymerase sigma-70 factor (ECF subfamily)
MPLPPLGGPVYRGGDLFPGWDALDHDEKSEERFIERLVSHDERAFNELVQAYEQRVYRLVFRMLGRRDEAEDMAQEVFVQVFKAIGTFRGDSKLGTWIYRIAVNLCKNRIKYLGRRHTSDEEELEPVAERSALDEKKSSAVGETSRPDQVVEGYQIEKIVQECMAALEADFREVLVLRDVEDLSYEELCEVTGLPDGTVKSRLHRARAMLKTAVETRLGEKIR